VFVGDKKYACETCIKGHRSSSCKHTDRPLFEIKKKGRPVTQCEHCRELRKTRQIHVKCVCESKDGGEGATGLGPGSSTQGACSLGCLPGGVKVPARATFPGGLPEELLEASAATWPLSEGSDSDQPGRGCCCKDDISCTCWTPRSQAKRPARLGERRGSESKLKPKDIGDPVTQPAALVISAHSGHNRPVLPKPPSDRPTSPPRSSHAPSSSGPVGSRTPSHGQAFYSPYGRAYEYAHSHEPDHSQQVQPESSTYLPSDVDYLAPNPAIDPLQNPGIPMDTWQDSSTPSMFQPAPGSPSLCNCGSTCACPGCVEHNGPDVDPSASCANPNTCAACFECNLIAISSVPPELAQTMYDPAQMQNVDEWLRQVSAMPEFTSTMSADPQFPASSQSDPRFDPSSAQAYGLWADPRTSQTTQPYAAVESECCGGRCKCPAGMCGCPPDCCGCCQGCTCSDCAHDGGSERTLTFATSGERAPCCGGRSHAQDRTSGNSASTGPQPGGLGDTVIRDTQADGPRFVDGLWQSQLLTVPRTRMSRASSLSSSKSSPNPSTSGSSSSPIPYPDSGGNPSQDGGAGTAPAVRSCCASMGNLTTT
ncbi:hypothetical protein BD413DRAFT_450414, partial [Trametes elegans]